MKTCILTLAVSVVSLQIARAQDTSLEFPRRSIDLPSLSLSGAAQQSSENRFPDMTPRISPTRTATSYMEFKKASARIDEKALIARPDATRDLRLNEDSPKVESIAK